MGVRFQCPNGHALHVKANLAGKRGICPDCGARFIVPSFSSGRVATAGGDAALGYQPSPGQSVGNTGGTVIAAAARTPEPPEAAAQPPTPPQRPSAVSQQGSAAAEAVWYVRTGDTTQYGPLDAATFRQWIDQGRIADDALVWRSGWDQWTSGQGALQLVGAAPPPVDGATDASDRFVVIPTVGGSAGSLSVSSGGQGVDDAAVDLEQGAANLRQLDRRRRKRRMQLVTFWLALAAVVLAAILAVIITRR